MISIGSWAGETARQGKGVTLMKKERFGSIGLILVVAFALAGAITGCSTLSRALSFLTPDLSSSSSGTSADTQTAEGGAQGGEATASADNSQKSRSMVPGFSPYQMQFYSVLAISAPFGGYGSSGRAYKPGEGTVWELSDKNRKEATTVEHALLKENSDGSQWWRLELTSGKETLLYEFLRLQDEKIAKVRYRDPDTKDVMEFVPDQAQSAPSAQASAPPQGEMSHDRQSVKVRAGTFMTDHAIYVDSQQGYRSEIWTSDTVPGGMVKFLTQHSGDLAQGELVKIEQGMTTVLQSF